MPDPSNPSEPDDPLSDVIIPDCHVPGRVGSQ